MSWMADRRFYVSDLYDAEEAINKLGRELADLKAECEENVTYAEFEQLEYRVSELEKKVDRIEKLIEKLIESNKQ